MFTSRNSIRKRKAILLTGAMTAVLAGTAAHAQADEPGVSRQSTGNQPIIVTAQFREQDVQDTPLAITAISGDMLAARSQSDISQIAGQAPNVSLRPQAGTFGPALAASIRGIGQYDFNTAFEPGVGVYVDDVYYPTLTGSVFDLLDLDRVEILRGPQGTLAGRNSIGGAIRLYSRRPEGSNSGSMTVTYGSRDRMEIRGSMDLGILPGVNFRMAGVAKEQDGYVDRLDYACLNPGSGFPQLTTNSNCRLGRDGGVGTMAFRGQLGLEPSDNLTITIIGDYTHEDHTTAGQVLRIANYTGPFDIDPYNTGTPFDSRFICGRYCNYATLIDEAEGTRPLVLADNRVTFEGFGFSGHVDLELSDALALQSITSYREFDTQFSTDNDLSPLAHSLGTNFLPFWAFSQEIRLNGQLFNEVVDFTLGGFYMDQRSYVETIQDLRYSPLPTFYQNDPVNADSKAAFAHASIHATDALTFNLGIRYTDEHKDYTFVRLPPFGGAGPLPILGPLNGVTGVYDGPQSTRFDYRANVSYEFTPDIMAYAQISTGFKGGGISPRPFNAAQVLPFAPETLTAYELGIKTDLLNRRLRLNAAVFLSDYNDLLLTLNPCPQISPGPCALQTNAGSATITGFELEMNAEPADGLLIDAALSYVDFDYDTINPLASSIQLDFVPPYTPKWKWSIGTQYEIPFGNGDSLTPRIDLTYQSEMYSNPTNAPSSLIESYTLVNARLTYTNEDADVDVSLQVTNLFDEYHILTVFDQSASAGYAINQPGRPREWAISVTKRF